MNLWEMICSNFEPIRNAKGYCIRKRLIHKGYEVLVKSGTGFIHVAYINDLK